MVSFVSRLLYTAFKHCMSTPRLCTGGGALFSRTRPHYDGARALPCPDTHVGDRGLDLRTLAARGITVARRYPEISLEEWKNTAGQSELNAVDPAFGWILRRVRSNA